MRLLALLALSLALLGCGDAASTGSQVDYLEPRFAVRVTRGLVYGAGAVLEPEPGDVELRLDLYEPEGDGAEVRAPGVLLMHGGGFIVGDRQDERIARIASELAARGYVAASIDYRLLAGSRPVPLTEAFSGFRAVPFFAATAAEDAARARAWLLANTAADPERLFIGGASAGAFAATTLAYSSDDVGVPEPPRFVGVFDLWGGSFQPEHVEADEAALFIVHGDADPTVAFVLSEQLVTRAQDVGLPFEFHRVTGAGHGFANVPLFTGEVEPGVTYFDRLLAFAAAQL